MCRSVSSDGPAMCWIMFLANRPTPRELRCTPSETRWSEFMFPLSINPQLLRFAMDFSRSLESSTFLRLETDWFLRWMIDEIVTDVVGSVSHREVIFAAIFSGLS